MSAKRAWVVAMRAAHEAAHARPQTGRHGGYAHAAAQAAAAADTLELSERRRQLDVEVTELNTAVLSLKAARRAVSERQRALTAFTTYLATDAAAEAAMTGGLHRAAPVGGWLRNLPEHYDASVPSHTDRVLRALQQHATEVKEGAGGSRRGTSASPHRRDSRGSGAGHHRHRSADRRGSPLKKESSSSPSKSRTTPQRRTRSWSSPAEVGMLRSAQSPSPAAISRQYGPGNATKGDGFLLASAVPFSPPSGE